MRLSCAKRQLVDYGKRGQATEGTPAVRGDKLKTFLTARFGALDADETGLLTALENIEDAKFATSHCPFRLAELLYTLSQKHMCVINPADEIPV